MNCVHCHSDNVSKRATKHRKRKSVEQYKCGECGKYSSKTILNSIISAKILLLDIETSPGEYYSWSRDPQYLSPEMMIKDWGILCWSAKWLFQPEIMGQSVTPREAIDHTERSILGEMWSLMNQADIIVTQNGIKFDIKRLNTKLIKAGYAPPSAYSNVDTLKFAKEKFFFTYNSLEELGRELLDLPDGKIKMNMTDWKQCVKGNQEYLDKMLFYCKNDVAPLLEDVYLALRPWMNHPNLNLYTNHTQKVCPNCESEHLVWGEEYSTPLSRWNGFRCSACGALGRGTKSKHKIKQVSIRSN